MTYEQGYRTHVDLLEYRTVPDYRLKEFVLWTQWRSTEVWTFSALPSAGQHGMVMRMWCGTCVYKLDTRSSCDPMSTRQHGHVLSLAEWTVPYLCGLTT